MTNEDSNIPEGTSVNERKMNRYYCTLYPGGWFYVIEDNLKNCIGEQIDPCGIIWGYKQAEYRNVRAHSKNGNDIPIYMWNNSLWFSEKSENITEFIKMFYELLQQ